MPQNYNNADQNQAESKALVKSDKNAHALTVKGKGSLLALTDSILSSAIASRKANQLAVDESWMQEIWEWADKFKIHDLQVPRDREKLLDLTSLDISSSDYHKLLVQNINDLTNYQSLYLWGDDFSELSYAEETVQLNLVN